MLLLPALTAWPQLQFYLKDDEPSTDVSDEESVFAINGKRIVLERTSLPNRTSAHHEAQTSCTVWDAVRKIPSHINKIFIIVRVWYWPNIWNELATKGVWI